MLAARARWAAFKGLEHPRDVVGLCGSLELRGSREKRKHCRLVFREKEDGRSDEAWGLFQARGADWWHLPSFWDGRCSAGSAQLLWRAVQVKVSWYSVFFIGEEELQFCSKIQLFMRNESKSQNSYFREEKTIFQPVLVTKSCLKISGY